MVRSRAVRAATARVAAHGDAVLKSALVAPLARRVVLGKSLARAQAVLRRSAAEHAEIARALDALKPVDVRAATAELRTLLSRGECRLGSALHLANGVTALPAWELCWRLMLLRSRSRKSATALHHTLVGADDGGGAR